MEEEKSIKKGGKRDEPTDGELEFIYERFVNKDTDEQVIRELNDEGFLLLRSKGFIKRRRREFDIAKKVLAKQAEGAYDTNPLERRKRHWTRLADRAQEFLDKLKTYFPYVDDYMLAEIAIDDEDYDLATLTEDSRSIYLLSHLKTDIPEIRNLESWSDLKINDIPKLLPVLGLRAESQQFVGTCEVCEDWVLDG
ncbi:MAG: hypothetical protein JW712_04530 [Dehalococcoidales bacterium]|nr:hypothetical protein [Dehalococcoidales bacterium]